MKQPTRCYYVIRGTLVQHIIHHNSTPYNSTPPPPKRITVRSRVSKGERALLNKEREPFDESVREREPCSEKSQ